MTNSWRRWKESWGQVFLLHTWTRTNTPICCRRWLGPWPGSRGNIGIEWVRRPLDFPLAGAYLAARLRRGGCRLTDHFAGFRLTGRLDQASLTSLIRGLPDGTTELMCHPGYLGVSLEAARTRLKASRQRELEALTSPEAKAAIQAAGVHLIDYRSLTVAARPPAVPK